MHGHVEPLVAALQDAGLLDSGGLWSGGHTGLTFLGDYFDRGPDGIAVVDLIRRLQDEATAAGGRVDAMIGNHEILALGMHRFGDQLVSGRMAGHSFARSWVLNGGQPHDQRRLSPEHVYWLSGLDSVVLAGSDLLLHSDTTEYLRWGETAERINDAVRAVLAGDDLEQWWQCWVRMTTRHAFAGSDGEEVAAGLLDGWAANESSTATASSRPSPSANRLRFSVRCLTPAGACWRSTEASTAEAPASLSASTRSPLHSGTVPGFAGMCAHGP